jgi:hypothetical protein
MFLKRFLDLVTDDLTRLHRFRRVAQNHQISLPDQSMPVDAEIEYLRDQLNASVYLEAKPWMCPSWVNLAKKGINMEETLITKLSNNSYRNWSLIGGVGSRRYGVTDSRGLVTALPTCGSVDIWVQGTDGIIFPALMGKDGPQLKLVSPEDQLYEWKTDIQSVYFVRLLYHVEQDGAEYIYNEVIMKNIALEETKTTFYTTLRPMSVLGFEPIEKVEYDKKTNQIFANDVLAIHFDITPSSVYIVEANDTKITEVIQSNNIRHDDHATSKLGLGTAIIRFDVTLPPAGIRTFVFASPLETPPDEDARKRARPNNHNRNLSIGNWYDFTKKNIEAFFPDEQLDSVLSQAAASLAIQSHSILLSEDSQSHSSSISWSDRIRILIAQVKSGGIDVATNIASRVVQKLRNSEGSLETTILGPLLWGLLGLQGYSLEKESNPENSDVLRQMAKKLVATLPIDQLGKEQAENLSDATAADELDDMPLEHYSVLNTKMLNEFNDLLWNIAALKESIRYFALTEVDLVAKIKDIIPTIEGLAQEKFDEIQNARWPRPQEPQMYEIDRAVLDILTSIVQLRIREYDMNFLKRLCKKVTARRLVRNLWKPQGPAEILSSHLALRIAQFHIWDKQRDAAEPLLRRALEFLSADFLLPDFVNPRTFGGSGGAGSSAVAAADVILLLTDMLVYEDESNLIFLAGIPSEWYTEKRPLIVKGLYTRFGKTSIEIGMSANQHQIETGMETLPDEIEIHVPNSVPLRMAKIYGGSIIDRAVKDSSPHLKLVPLSDVVVLTYHR